MGSVPWAVNSWRSLPWFVLDVWVHHAFSLLIAHC